jgi:molecular chaperone GrpE
MSKHHQMKPEGDTTEKEENVEAAAQKGAETAENEACEHSDKAENAEHAEAADATAKDKEETAKTETDEKTGEVDKLAEAEAKIADLQDKYLRQLAEFDNYRKLNMKEFDNYRKRTMKEKEELIQNGGEHTLTAILPVVDDLERALQTMENATDVAAVKEGVELVYHKFMKILESQGLKKIETKDQDFNTDFHEAIAMIPAQSDEQKGKIIDCVQAGYTLNDKVIRHAKVAIGQ